MACPAAGEDADTLLSRSGTSGSTGKLVRRLDVPVSEELEEAVIVMASLAGVPKSEYVRQVLERQLFGELPMARRMLQPLRSRTWDEHGNSVG
jgi:hypothetical protein